MDPTDYGNMIDGYSASGTIATIISLAKDVGVLDILCNSDVALTSQQIADNGQLKERYVREMLGSLVCGKVVQVDSQTSSLFSISPELKPVVKEKAVMSQFVPYFGDKYNAIKKCLSRDGPAGVRYSEYPAIFNFMDELRESSQDKLLDSDILPSYVGLVDKLKTGIDVMEIGCANGTLLLNLCKRFPNSRFYGTDVVDSVLDIARKRGADRSLTNCEFMILDVCTATDFPKKRYDWIFARDVIHDIPDPAGALSRLFEMLSPGGVFSMVEYGVEGTIAENEGKMDVSFLYGASVFVCIPESYQGQGSEALGPCWGVKKARQIIADAGFSLINEHHSQWSKSEVTFVCQRPL